MIITHINFNCLYIINI